jgi:hypothetical protein
LRPLSKIEIKLLADEIDQSRSFDPDAARELLWTVARRYGRPAALSVVTVMFEKARARLAAKLPDRAA